MSQFALKTENLGKKYLIDRVSLRQLRARTFRDAVSDHSKTAIRRLTGKQRNSASRREAFWALRDINMEIAQGDIVGVIGRNGAGKSTLLKLLCRITDPSEGRFMLRGRVASLLEVGTGFHPELTGRENIYMNGAILGMTRQEIRARFDEIVAFSEVERFLDTPVKRYSSGMQVRLAFAVAAHLEPEILLVDEVLAVGDLRFQKKCIGKMEEVGRAGRTILFVSHNMALVNSLCHSGILLENGRIAAEGRISEVVEHYISSGEEIDQQQTSDELLKDDTIDVDTFISCDESGNPKNRFRTSENVCAFIQYQLKEHCPGVRIGIDVYNQQTGEIVFRTFDDDMEERERTPGEYSAICRVPANLLFDGLYAIRLVVVIHRVRWITEGEYMRRISIDHVDGVNARYGGKRPGAVLPEIDWELLQGAERT